MVSITLLLECEMPKKSIHLMKPEHIEEAKHMFGEILKEVESGERCMTTITIKMSETGISILITG